MGGRIAPEGRKHFFCPPGRIRFGLPGGGRGEHRRPLPHASCKALAVRAVRPFHSATSHRRSRITTALTELLPPKAVRQAWTERYGRALPSRREQGEPLSRRSTVPREGPLGHVVRRRGASECQRVVMRHVQPWTRAAGTASSKLGVDGPGHERAPPGRFSLEPAPLRRTGGLLSLSC